MKVSTRGPVGTRLNDLAAMVESIHELSKVALAC